MKFITISTLSTSFMYAYVDAAGKQDPTPATYTINLSVALAETFGTFSGKATELGNVLTWTALTETPGTKYLVQRSTDGHGFTTIGTIDGSGSGPANHSFTDESPTPNTPNNYRLEWTDVNGNIAFSNVVTIAASLMSGVMDVTPTPFRDQLTVRLSLNSTQRVAIRLLDSKGVLIQQAQYQGAKGVNSFALEGLSSLPVSVYLVQIILVDQVFVRKVFNNR
jgi:hypothetical protein